MTEARHEPKGDAIIRYGCKCDGRSICSEEVIIFVASLSGHIVGRIDLFLPALAPVETAMSCSLSGTQGLT